MTETQILTETVDKAIDQNKTKVTEIATLRSEAEAALEQGIDTDRDFAEKRIRANKTVTRTDTAATRVIQLKTSLQETEQRNANDVRRI